jgi:hypothetical protein
MARGGGVFKMRFAIGFGIGTVICLTVRFVNPEWLPYVVVVGFVGLYLMPQKGCSSDG